MSLVSALNALRFAQVVVLVVEATQGKFSKVDLQLARKCMLEGRALVVAANKADLLPQSMTRSQYEEGVRKHCAAFLPELGNLRVVCCVANKREGVNRLLHTVLEVHDIWSKRIDTWVLNSWFKDLMVAMPAARADGKPIKIKYITQVKSRPPTFALFTNTAVLPTFLERFLRARLQQDFSLHGVPLRFIIRKAEVPERYRQQNRQRNAEQEGGRTTVHGLRRGTASPPMPRPAVTGERRGRVRNSRSSAAGPRKVLGHESLTRSRTKTVIRRRQIKKSSNK